MWFFFLNALLSNKSGSQFETSAQNLKIAESAFFPHIPS